MKPVYLEESGALVLKTATHLWIHLNGQTRCLEVQSRRSRKNQQQEQDPSLVRAPMPGKIIKIMCGAGDSVVAGQTLVVMEAMKMEYALKASKDGEVLKRPCVVDQQVALGDLLVQLKVKE